MARRSVTTLTKSDEQDPIETVSSSPATPVAGAGDEVGAANVEPMPAGAESGLSALPPEIDESGLNITPGALRQMVALEEERREIIREFIARNLKSGTDFGTIMAGRRETKPSLFKPGAEKICLLFQLRPKFTPDRATLAMAGNPPGLFAYVCRLIDRQGRIVGEGRGAADLSERNGWTVIDRRWGGAEGELDLVCLDPHCVLVGVEVRARRTERSGSPLESVDPAHLRRLRAALGRYATQSSQPRARIRLDLVGVVPDVDGGWRLTRHPSVDGW